MITWPRTRCDPNALYVIWGGGNDLFNDDSAANVTATAERVAVLTERLAHAGAKYIMVPNIPPLGLIPKYMSDPAKQRSLSAAAADYREQLRANLTASINDLALLGFTPRFIPSTPGRTPSASSLIRSSMDFSTSAT